MTVYHINKGIGPSSSGIEYAQKYRFDLVKQFPEKQLFIYCDYSYNNYSRFTEKIGIDIDVTLNAYKFMAGQKNHASTFMVDDFQLTLPSYFLRKDDGEKAVNFSYGESLYKVWLIPGTFCIDRVDTIVSQHLQEVAHYSDRLTNIDYYNGKEIFCRYFFNEDGEQSMKQFLHEGKILVTFLGDSVLYGKGEFYNEFFHRLNFGKGDLVIIDRNAGIAAELLQNKNDAKYAVVIHAEHFSERMIDDNWVLWNNHYEFVFSNRKYIDYFIVSTDKQKKKLKDQFNKMGSVDTKIITIPVGFINELNDGQAVEENKYKFMTASRLAAEKHIDVLVRAVVALKEELPEIEFHIYGAGKLVKELRDLIAKLNAKDFVKLHGHLDLDNSIYGSYGGYLTASSSEGFGLTLLEAVSACLPIIGLDVDYGNSEFIKNGINGFCISPKSFKNEEEQVEIFSNMIRKMVQEMDYKCAIEFSKTKAKSYLAENVKSLWRDFYDISLGKKPINSFEIGGTL
ncbi:MAG TPA: glycosyltransferase [Lactovum miscens]|uniref:glycosyltransferase n=1 Tax=Lactovum miscens TaxID=190387 RepID=UPI002ED8620D